MLTQGNGNPGCCWWPSQSTSVHSGVASVQRLRAKLISRVPSSSLTPIPLPSFLSLLPSPSFLTFLPLLFFSPSFLQKIKLGVWGSAASSPAGPGEEPRPPKHFCHILRPEDVLILQWFWFFLHGSKYPSESRSIVLVATPSHSPVMIISYRICADLRIDPREGWGGVIAISVFELMTLNVVF